MSFFERLQKLMDEKKITQVDLAALTGLTQGAISDWKSRDVMPKADLALKIARHFGVSVEYLIEGEGKENAIMPPQAQKVQGKNVIPFSQNQDDGVVYIPFYEDVKASAGQGIEIEDYSSAVTLPMLRSFIQPYNPRTVKAIEVLGDSMTGIHLLPGDTVFFVPDENPSDGLYVIGIEDKLFVKRLEIDVFGHEIRVISENDKYPPKAVKGEDMERLRIIGKVIGWITRHSY